MAQRMTIWPRRWMHRLLMPGLLAALMVAGSGFGVTRAADGILDLKPDPGSVSVLPPDQDGDEDAVDSAPQPRRGPATGPRSARGQAPASPQTQAEEAQPPLPDNAVTVGFVPTVCSAQLLVIAGKGWGAAEDMPVVPVSFARDKYVLEALMTGEVDVAYTDPGLIIHARAKTQPVRILAAASYDSMELLVRGDLSNAIGVGNAAGSLHRYALDHRSGSRVTIATLPKHTLAHTVLMYWVRDQARLTPEDVRVAGTRLSRIWNALLRGDVEMAFVPGPVATTVINRDPTARVVAEGSRLMRGLPCSVVASRDDVIMKKRPQLRTLLSLHQKATEMLIDTPEQAAPYLTQDIGYGRIGAQEMLQALKAPSARFIADPEAVAEPMARLLRRLLQSGALGNSLSAADMINSSIYREATGQVPILTEEEKKAIEVEEKKKKERDPWSLRVRGY